MLRDEEKYAHLRCRAQHNLLEPLCVTSQSRDNAPRAGRTPTYADAPALPARIECFRRSDAAASYGCAANFLSTDAWRQ